MEVYPIVPPEPEPVQVVEEEGEEENNSDDE